MVKRYVPEVGTAWVRALALPIAGHTLLIAQVTSAEIVSGVARRRRAGTISPRTAHAIRLLVDRHMRREYLVIALQAPVLLRAEDLLETHPLRAYDAVQIASALESNEALPTRDTGRPGPAKTPAFAATYPRLARSIMGDGWVELGRTDYGQSLARALKEGGLVLGRQASRRTCG